MRVLYLDAFSGISGDMTVGAFLDLGLPLAQIEDAIAVLGLAEVTVSLERVVRNGVTAAKFHVRVRGEHPDERDRFSRHHDSSHDSRLLLRRHGGHQ